MEYSLNMRYLYFRSNYQARRVTFALAVVVALQSNCFESQEQQWCMEQQLHALEWVHFVQEIAYLMRPPSNGVMLDSLCCYPHKCHPLEVVVGYGGKFSEGGILCVWSIFVEKPQLQTTDQLPQRTLGVWNVVRSGRGRGWGFLLSTLETVFSALLFGHLVLGKWKQNPQTINSGACQRKW